MKKINLERRKYYDTYIPLRDVAPMDTPFSIQIDPTNKCNFRCRFCPTADDELLASVGRPKAMMGLKLFRKIIADIAAFPRKLRRLQLYKDGEPFLNKHIYEMIAHAKERDIASIVSTTTNGSLLTGQNIGALLDAGLDHIQISIEHVHDEGYRDITGKNIRYTLIRDNIRCLFEEKSRRKAALHMHVKIIDTGLTDAEKQRFYDDFADISDSINITALMGWSHSEMKDFRLGLRPEVGIDGFSLLENRLVCPDPLKNMAVNADGSVSVCCVDWSHATGVGDTRTENLVDIWNGDRLFEFRKLHLSGRRGEIPPCRDCHRIKTAAPPSNIDDVAADILELIEAQHATFRRKAVG